MGWNEANVMDERRRFVMEHLKSDLPMSALCAAFGISRQTGYKWLGRFERGGLEGLRDLSSAPLAHGRQTPEAIREAIISLRRTRPDWGPKKLIGKLKHVAPETVWPAPSTAGEILKEAGLVSGRRRRFRTPPHPDPLSAPLYPNHVWSADHKGWTLMKTGGRLEPLTITDGFSRYLILLSAMPSKKSEEAIPLFLKAFDVHGLPDAIRTDNGVPFACAGVTGLTPLSILFARLGIAHERIAPGKPQQNGRHERFHATLSPQMREPAASHAEQEARFCAFRDDYNKERPHEALGQRPPASCYAPSQRRLPTRLPAPDYDKETAIRRVKPNGTIKWRGREIYVTPLLEGQDVAVDDQESGFEVRYYKTRLGRIDLEKNTLGPIPRTTMKPQKLSTTYPV